MKKLSFLLFAIFIALSQFSSVAHARESSSDSPIADTLTPPGETGAACEIDEASIPEIQFYAGNCLTRSDEGTDIDLNLNCTFSAPIYRSYCNDIPACDTSDTSLVCDMAKACLEFHHCSSSRRTSPPPGGEISTLSSINPNTTQEGSVAFTLTVMGTNFTSESHVLWNGRTKTTSYVSATELHAQIDVTDIAHASTIPVSVIRGAVVSSTVNFTITARPADLHTETPPPPPHAGGTATTAIGTEHAADTNTSTEDVSMGDGGGCSFNALSSGSLSFSFGWVLISFVMGSFLMMRKRKK